MNRGIVRVGALLVTLAAFAPLHAAETGVTGLTAVLEEDATLWNRPLSDAAVLALLKENDSVTLIESATNSSGAWWYVRTAAGTGWMRESRMDSAGAARRARHADVLRASSRQGRALQGPFCKRKAAR